jgi:NAD(P)H-dependent FMN reductase
MTDPRLVLHVLICSTRPGRTGPTIASWVDAQAREHGAFAVELVDLAAFALPILDEAEHPRLGRYAHEPTLRWSASVARADAFVFVLPEYDFSMPASLLNALQCLYEEWTYKPVAFASYGGESGGLRSTQMTKLAVTTFKMVPVVEGVTIARVAQHLDEATGLFTADQGHAKKAKAMLDELHRWATALRPMRAPRA